MNLTRYQKKELYWLLSYDKTVSITEHEGEIIVSVEKEDKQFTSYIFHSDGEVERK